MHFGREAGRILLSSAVNVCEMETKTVGFVYSIGGIMIQVCVEKGNLIVLGTLDRLKLIKIK